ncbi:probable disease resistance protein RF45 [Camellia sinensis]|uniref:probable disease resistance protein RF45 n=1 Tax=Camellia sinensis TaxID=4442 RepID=UPI001036F1A5|nr:probable disease resistance protein RF45 [Camellia sinensis]XP_028064167.1 probable disease resistance protein RF45 [Camellia sinensis]
MAESVALSFATFVVKSLGGFLIQEANNLGGVRPQVEQLRHQLTRMQCFLEVADARPRGGANEIIIRNCVAEIREASYDAEAAIATFVVKIGRSDQFPFVLKRYLCIFKEYLALREVRLEIEAINTWITNSLTTGFQTCAILNSMGVRESSSSTSVAERQRQLRRSYTHIVEEDVVGVEEDVKAIVDLLVKENCRVVSIWGMGGLGKTTLAKTVYKHFENSHHFKCVAWAYISQQCNTREVLKGILIKLLSPSDEHRKAIGRLNLDDLLKQLHQVQSEKKCLVILDDIWQDTDWDSLSPGFPNTTEVGSKILLTTRNENVAKHVDQQCVLYKLRHLTEKESWELFEKKIFLRRNEGFALNTEMIELGKAMVKHCGGVPLAIVVLGGLLATTDAPNDWKRVSENISYDLGNGRGRAGVPITEILAISYQDLPYHLKACFLYLSHLPEDHDIRAKKLIQMWMAEGIVSPSSIPTQVEVKEKTMLDVGMSYLGELVQRCMVQVQLTSFRKRIKLCRLHDLMRDLCLLKAKEENFLEIVCIKAFGHQLAWADSTPPSSSSPLTTIHRLAVYYLNDCDANSIESENVIPLSGHEMKNHNHIRSCQFYSFGHKLESSGWQKLKLLLKGLTLLTVLDLERIIIPGGRKKFPRAIGNLIYLRYLSVRDSDIKSLPSSIGNLGFLQTLDLRVRWCLIRIPNVLWRLKKLRHLYLPGGIKLSCIGKLRLDGLSKLETLKNFDARKCDVRCLSKLINLRKFSVEVAPKDLVVMLKSPILNNSNRLLQYSSFSIRGDFRTEEEQSLLRQLLGCQHLRQLYLEHGSLNQANKLPDQFPPNLTKLWLRHTKLEEDPMPTLEKFPNLRTLCLLKDSYIGKAMVCSSGPSSISGGGGGGGYGGCDGGGFPKLISLELWNIENLEEWRVEQGAMPCLFHLQIGGCRKLKEIPDGLRFITTLRELDIKYSSEALRDRVREGGEDFYKFKDVPSIIL